MNYDRTAASRTTVIDDQSDYFEIESNAWLTNKEKAELKRRKELEEEQEQKLRNQIHVTFDLLGNKVIVTDAKEVKKETTSSNQQNDNEALERAKIASDNLGLGLGPAAKNALAENLKSMTSNGDENDLHLERTRVHVNPSIHGAAPLFLLPDDNERGTTTHSKVTPANKLKPAVSTSRQNISLIRNSRIIQDDEPSLESLAMTAEQQKASSRRAAQAPSTTFDIGASSELGKKAIVRPLPSIRETKSYSILADGFIVLRNFLSIEEQKLIVGTCRKLGVTSGLAGFSSPTYADGARLHLQMMCLGRYWDLNHHCYADKFGVKENDRPHSIPQHFQQLVDKCLNRTNEIISNEKKNKKHQGLGHLPGMTPDVCLCNFYSHSGTLGMQLDKVCLIPVCSLPKVAPVIRLHFLWYLG